MNIAAVVMASGASTRMGENKLLLDINHKPMIQHVFDCINACDLKVSLVVSCYEEILNMAVLNHMKPIHNGKSYMGQSQSVVLGTQWIKEHYNDIQGILFFPGDMPYIKPQVINKIIECFKLHPHCIIRPRYHDENHCFFGNPVMFPEKLFNELCTLEGDQGGKSIINNYENDVYIVDIYDGIQGLDIDTQSEYKKIILK